MSNHEPQTAAAFDFEQYARTAAQTHAEQYREQVPAMLENMPTSPGEPSAVHAALDLLGAALEETARASLGDAPGC